MEKKRSKLCSISKILANRNCNSNKSRTNLLVLANEDLKSTIKNSETKINSKNLNEFIKEFDTVIVNLAKETFTSHSNISQGEYELSKNFVKVNFHKRSSSKKDFDYRKKRFSVSEKKMEFFNRKLRESMEENLKSNYNTNMTEEDNLRANNLDTYNQRKSGSRNSESQRKYSLIRLREKLIESKKSEKKFEKATEGYEYLQSLCFAIKKESSIIQEEKEVSRSFYKKFEKNRPSAKSCEKRNLKMLSELMRDLQENIDDEEDKKLKMKYSEKSNYHKLKSLTRTKKSIQDFENNNFNFFNNKINKNDWNILKPKLESSDADSNTSPKDSISKEKEYLHNSATTIRSTSHHSSLELKRVFRVNSSSLEESLYEKEFKINVYRCSFSSLADPEREMEYFYGPTGYTPKTYKDFNIQLKNCRMSKDEYDSLSRKMSEITPPSSVNEDLNEV